MNPIYLIRHGKTQANLCHLYCGSTDLPLSQQGIDQLRTLHYHLPRADPGIAVWQCPPPAG